MSLCPLDKKFEIFGCNIFFHLEDFTFKVKYHKPNFCHICHGSKDLNFGYFHDKGSKLQKKGAVKNYSDSVTPSGTLLSSDLKMATLGLNFYIYFLDF